jgi:hypothetical protein
MAIASAADGERKPFVKREGGDRKPYAKPFAKGEGRRQAPFVKREDGDRMAVPQARVATASRS